MKLKPFKRVPVLIATGVVLLVGVLQALHPGFLGKLEWMTYDWRVRVAKHFPSATATNLGFVAISDESIAALNNGSLGYHYGLYWPRQIYGRLVRELSAQGAKAAAFDIIFGELHPNDTPVPVKLADHPEAAAFFTALHPGEKAIMVEDAILLESDDFFAWQLARASNVILAAEKTVLPHELFATNAFRLGDIPAEQDADGILRRARAFKEYHQWHPLFKQVAADPDFGVDLNLAAIEPGQLVLPRKGLEVIKVPLDTDGNFSLADLVGDKLPPGMLPKAKPFNTTRVWHMGIVLAAQELKLDLARAEVDRTHGRIALRGENGVERVIPIDAQDSFYVDWTLASSDSRMTQAGFEKLLEQDQIRSGERSGTLTNRLQGKLLVIGSSAVGNDFTDRGATPLEENGLLAAMHWNVANSLIQDRFIHRSSLMLDLLFIALMGAVAAYVTWQWRAFSAAGGILLLVACYSGAAVFLYVRHRLWLPMVLPVLIAPLMQYLCLVTYRAIFEERERRRVKSIFSKLVSPNVVHELLESEKVLLGGARRVVTVMFADVRGFTELTDRSREQAAEFVRQNGLSGEAAEACFDDQARETLKTVNLYLALVADTVKRHEGTLDKYIGDCVMAFWGAPTPDPHHARDCVRAAIDAQQAIHSLNQQRVAENQRREQTDPASPPDKHEPPLPTLVLGTGINTGAATVGLMGSDDHILNYTVFGREVNLASRLEGLSGRGRIVIGETTFNEIQRDDPALAATCVALPAAEVKGFRDTVQIYEVPWRTDS